MWHVPLQSKQEEEAKKLMESIDEIKKRLAAKEVEVQEARITLDAKVTTIVNIMQESVTTRWSGKLVVGYLVTLIILVFWFIFSKGHRIDSTVNILVV